LPATSSLPLVRDVLPWMTWIPSSPFSQAVLLQTSDSSKLKMPSPPFVVAVLSMIEPPTLDI
jgi:hypothetical protein